MKKNLPEKIYLQAEECCKENSDKKICVEYIRSDIAEQMAKNFKCYKDKSWKYSVEDEYTEFINSQKE